MIIMKAASYTSVVFFISLMPFLLQRGNARAVPQMSTENHDADGDSSQTESISGLPKLPTTQRDAGSNSLIGRIMSDEVSRDSEHAPTNHESGNIIAQSLWHGEQERRPLVGNNVGSRDLFSENALTNDEPGNAIGQFLSHRDQEWRPISNGLIGGLQSMTDQLEHVYNQGIGEVDVDQNDFFQNDGHDIVSEAIAFLSEIENEPDLEEIFENIRSGRVRREEGVGTTEAVYTSAVGTSTENNETNGDSVVSKKPNRSSKQQKKSKAAMERQDSWLKKQDQETTGFRTLGETSEEVPPSQPRFRDRFPPRDQSGTAAIPYLLKAFFENMENLENLLTDPLMMRMMMVMMMTDAAQNEPMNLPLPNGPMDLPLPNDDSPPIVGDRNQRIPSENINNPLEAIMSLIMSNVMSSFAPSDQLNGGLVMNGYGEGPPVNGDGAFTGSTIPGSSDQDEEPLDNNRYELEMDHGSPGPA